jgi:uncharacterized protein (DUF433 family)
MSTQLTIDQIPVRKDACGTIRIGDTRVTLDCVAASFEAGATPEVIVDQFPSLNLSDVYFVLGYYLARPQELADYLAEGRRIAQENEMIIERYTPVGIRERLLARSKRDKE